MRWVMGVVMLCGVGDMVLAVLLAFPVQVWVENGTLIQGVITKDTVGNKAGSLGHIVALEQVSACAHMRCVSACVCMCVCVYVHVCLSVCLPVCVCYHHLLYTSVHPCRAQMLPETSTASPRRWSTTS